MRHTTNQITSTATRTETGVQDQPAVEARRFTVEGAVYDAVNGVAGRYAPLHVGASAPAGTSREAAAVEAAYRTLSWAFASHQAALDDEYAASLARLAAQHEDGIASRALQRGLRWGHGVAAAYISWRSNDGFSPVPEPFSGSNAIGVWRPTPPGFAAGAFRSSARPCPSASRMMRPGASG